MTHTPGPWKWYDFGGELILHSAEHGRPVVLRAGMDNSLGGWDPPGRTMLYARNDEGRLVPLTPDHPDARLIAAAPDLLAALQMLLKSAAHDNSEAGPAVRDWLVNSPVIDVVRAAIARARGE